MLQPDYPEILDLSSSDQLNLKQREFFTKQLSHELQMGRYSTSIGTSLLPGMYCMPIYAVPKPHSEDLCLINDHSVSEFSLNSMVNHKQVTGYPMDNLAIFGDMLLSLRDNNQDLEGKHAITVWKSDISEAYRLCPMHPVWQIKQVVCVAGQYYIDCCIVFGSSASPAIFIAFNSLVTWIVKYKQGISFIATYLDDSSGCAWSDDQSYYAPYKCHLPTPQARLLALWDELGIPHKQKKQVHGLTLPVIGIQVNTNAMI